MAATPTIPLWTKGGGKGGPLLPIYDPRSPSFPVVPVGGGAKHGFIYPVGAVRGVRYNLIVNLNSRVPAPLWSDPTFLRDIGSDGVSVPVGVSRLRSGVFSKPVTLSIPINVLPDMDERYAGGLGQINDLVGVLDLEQGDFVWIAYNPGVLIWEGLSSCGGVCGPIVSVIDEKSRDAVSEYPVLTEVEERVQ